MFYPEISRSEMALLSMKSLIPANDYKFRDFGSGCLRKRLAAERNGRETYEIDARASQELSAFLKEGHLASVSAVHHKIPRNWSAEGSCNSRRTTVASLSNGVA